MNTELIKPLLKRILKDYDHPWPDEDQKTKQHREETYVALENFLTNSSVILHCHNEKAAEEFCIWMCEQGEQDYWTWMEEVDQKNDGANTMNFEYHYPQDKSYPANSNKRYARAKFSPGNEFFGIPMSPKPA